MTKVALVVAFLAACEGRDESASSNEPVIEGNNSVFARHRFASHLEKKMPTGVKVEASGDWFRTLTITGMNCSYDTFRSWLPRNEDVAVLDDHGFTKIECGWTVLERPWRFPAPTPYRPPPTDEAKQETWTEYEERKKKWLEEGNEGDPPPLE